MATWIEYVFVLNPATYVNRPSTVTGRKETLKS